MPEHPSISAPFAKLQAWMDENAPGVTFRPPANPAALDHFSARSGLTLPVDLRQLLLLADGETRKSAGSIGNWRLMPIAEIQAAWGWLTQLAAKGAFSDLSPDPSPYIHSAWWYSGWIPFVSNDDGNYYCIDTQPPDPERCGQVLLFLQDRPMRPLVAESLSAWLERITRDLLAEVYRFDEYEGFNGEAFLWSSLEGKHLFDDIAGKLIVDEAD